MEIKDLNHAIDLTIKAREYSIKIKEPFEYAKLDLVPKEWLFTCPLCEFFKNDESSDTDCSKCPVVTIEGVKQEFIDACDDYQFMSPIDYKDNHQSIARLESWKRGEKFDVEAYNQKMKG
jgi:hypothetical protein